MGSTHFLTLYVLLKPEKAKILSAWAWSLISIIWKKAEYRAISKELEGNIEVFVKDLTKEMSGVKIKTPTIQFVYEETREAFIKKNRVIIKLKPKDDQNYNFAVASHLFVQKTTLPTIKKVIEKDMGDAIDLYMGRKFLEKRRRDAIENYLEEFYLPKVRTNKQIQKYLEEFEKMDDYGLFTRIVLQELLYLEKQSIGKTNIVHLSSEFIGLKEFILNIINRDVGEHVPLFFEGKLTKLAVILVAITARRKAQGTVPYTTRFEKNIEQGAKHIYFISWDRNNKFLGEVIEAIKNKHPNVKLRKVNKYKVTGESKWFNVMKIAGYEIPSQDT